MADLARGAALVAATLATGHIAGLYYAFACSVMPGLARSSDRTFVETMQQINRAILNGWFFATFAGALVLTTLAAVLHLGRPPFAWILAALALYVASLVITRAINVPLNNELDASGSEDDALARKRFEPRWVRWNLIRGLACTAALACLSVALLV